MTKSVKYEDAMMASFWEHGHRVLSNVWLDGTL